MSGLELNKIFAAVLCALILIYMVGYLGDSLVHEPPLEKDAIAIEGEVIASHGAAAPVKPKLPDPIMQLLASADIAKGAKLSKACTACHSFEKEGPTKQGPNLWNIINSPKAHITSFSYSDGLKTAGGDWDYDSMNKFIWKPKKFIKGTKMNFAGLKKPQDRANLIAWMRSQSDDQAALPSEADIAAEAAERAPKELPPPIQ